MQPSPSDISTILVTPLDGDDGQVSPFWGDAPGSGPLGDGSPQGSPGEGDRQVWVGAAVTRDAELRSIREVVEWALEPVMDSEALALSFLLVDGSTQSFLLGAMDAQDLVHALGHVHPALGAPVHQDLNTLRPQPIRPSA